MKTLFIGTVAVGVALGLAWPANDATPHEMPAASEVILHRSSDRHFYAEAKVDGKPIRFLIDTGSSAIALTAKDARTIGIDIKPNDYQLIGQGASGLVRGKTVEIDTIELGDIRQDKAKIVVIEGADVSLLGQPFLELADEIVIRRDEMLIRKASRP